MGFQLLFIMVNILNLLLMVLVFYVYKLIDAPLAMATQK